MDLKFKRKYQAENGQNGMKRNRFGKKGENLYIKVPVGTLIIDKETGTLMKDLRENGDEVIAAKGGKEDAAMFTTSPALDRLLTLPKQVVRPRKERLFSSSNCSQMSAFLVSLMLVNQRFCPCAQVPSLRLPDIISLL